MFLLTNDTNHITRELNTRKMQQGKWVIWNALKNVSFIFLESFVLFCWIISAVWSDHLVSSLGATYAQHGIAVPPYYQESEVTWCRPCIFGTAITCPMLWRAPLQDTFEAQWGSSSISLSWSFGAPQDPLLDVLPESFCRTLKVVLLGAL